MLLATTLFSSVVVFRSWLNISTSWVRRRQISADIAELSLPDLPGIVGAFLPRKLRIVWNVVVLGGCFLLLGLPHLLVLRNFFRTGNPAAWDYFHYFWTLVYWLSLLILPALLVARHRVALQQRTDLNREEV